MSNQLRTDRFIASDDFARILTETTQSLVCVLDEQGRIVQEGLGNVRKHAGAHRAEVRIEERAGRRLVSVRDDGAGFDGEERDAGQGLKNIRARTASIDGSFTLRSRPGFGTLLEVTLRA